MPRVPLSAAAIALLLSSGGALAQEAGACGQPAVLTQTLNEALRPGFDERIARMQLPRGETRYVTFRLDAAQTVHFWAEDEIVDPLLTIYDSAGTVMGFDDDGAGTLNSRLTLDLAAGVYCAQMRILDAELPPQPVVNLWMSSTGDGFPAPRVDGVADPALACTPPALSGPLATLAAGYEDVTLRGLVDETAGQAGYQLTVTEPLPVQLEARSDDLDTVLLIVDGAGAVLHENDDHEGTDSRLAVALDEGAYCVVVRSYEETPGAFEIALTTPAPGTELGSDAAPETGLGEIGPVCADPAETQDLASGLAAGFAPFSVEGRTDATRGRVDYRFSTADDLALQVEALSTSLDTLLAVFDAAGEIVADNDDHPALENNNSRVEANLPAGDYCIVVAGYDNATGPFTLAVSPPGGAAAAAPLPAIPEASAIEDLGPLTGRLESKRLTRDRTLWTAFTLDAEGAVTLDAGNLNGGFELILMAETGDEIARAYSPGSLERASLSENLPAGRYYAVIVNAVADDTLQVRQIVVLPGA